MTIHKQRDERSGLRSPQSARLLKNMLSYIAKWLDIPKAKKLLVLILALATSGCSSDSGLLPWNIR